MNTLDHLEKLVAFDTVSHRSNLNLIAYVEDILKQKNVSFERIPDATNEKANLFATIGPKDTPGVILSAHSDVVPVEGQNWSSDPFKLVERDAKLFGRGTTDMKGFLASSLALIDRIDPETLSMPIHLALSHDEETGCIGAKNLVQAMKNSGVKSLYCIVGEPTSMEVAIGHKGRVGAHAVFEGVGGHSAMAPEFLNAIYMASEFMNILREKQQEIIASSSRDLMYDIPFTTLHTGKISAGAAVNIVPRYCNLDFEIRNISCDNAELILQDVLNKYEVHLQTMRSGFPDANMTVSIVSNYPGFEIAAGHPVVDTMRELAGGTGITKVPYGTEAGLFATHLDIPTVVCGPGSMDQGHTPDEYIDIEQLNRCDAMLDRLLSTLTA